MSTELSMECQSRVSMEGIDWHSTTDAFSTHDPISDKNVAYVLHMAHKISDQFFDQYFNLFIVPFKLIVTSPDIGRKKDNIGFWQVSLEN